MSLTLCGAGPGPAGPSEPAGAIHDEDLDAILGEDDDFIEED